MWASALGIWLGLMGTDMVPLEESLTSRGYEEVAREDGVTVYKHPGEDLLVMAAEGTFAAPPEEVRRVLLDYEGHKKMLERVAVSRVLQRGPGWMLVYQRLSITVISDRDYTLRVTWGAEGDILWTRFETDNARGPPEIYGVVRMPVHAGSWQLKPVDDGKHTRARYQVSIDMAGLVPRWMVNTSEDFEIPDLFNAFRRELARRR